MIRRKHVRLNGKDYAIDSEKIRKLVSRLEPKAIDKYWVEIDGRQWPPKQLVSELLDIPLVNFTTMDATRVLTAGRFKVHSESAEEPVRTASETLLQEYLLSQGLTDFEMEPAAAGAMWRPDCCLRVNGKEVLLEVKDYREHDRFLGGYRDPYGGLREEIAAGCKEFQGIAGKSCCLVLHKQKGVSLDWQMVVAAMLGGLTFTRPKDQRQGSSDISIVEKLPSSGITMHQSSRESTVAQQNATTSAVIVIEQYGIGEKRFRLYIHQREQELGRDLGVGEYLQLAEEAAGTELDISLNRIRVRVIENPHAIVPLDRQLFRGTFDERYGEIEGSRWGRIYAGRAVAEFEEKSATAKLLSRC
jgi:hypothetical protein